MTIIIITAMSVMFVITVIKSEQLQYLVNIILRPSKNLMQTFILL